MKNIFTYLSIATLFLLSCAEDKSAPFLKKKEKHNPFIFNLQHYFADNEFNVSFPIWFNDSLIKLNRIESITRSIYLSGNDAEEEFTSPKEVKTYFFNEDGELLSIQVQQFYENVEVANVAFDYLSPKDENGFSTVERRRDKKYADDEFHDHYIIYEKEDYTEKFLVYTNEQTGNYLFYLLKRKNWGAVSVDSILQPTPDDIITLGTTYYPKKTYQVENTVNEFNVVKYTYDKSNRFIKEVLYNDYPFRKKRTILYNQYGVCNGYVDSTFTDDKFLKRRESKFEFDKKLPITLKHLNHSQDTLTGFSQLEKFEYSYFIK